jgi:phospholipase/carboxylesterase
MDAYTFREIAGASGDAPLFFVFHGTGGTEDSLLGLAADLMAGARIVSPRGDVLEGGAARFFRRTAEGVYDMDDLSRATAKMAGFVRGFLGDGRPRRVAGLGYSNGANILASVLFAAPELFDAAVLMHPLIPFVPAPQPGLAGKRVLVTAGRRDPICPPAATEALTAWFRAQGAAIETVWHPGGHELARDELLAARTFLSA